MQSREELRQSKNEVSEKGKKYHFWKGGGINTLFRPKCRALNLNYKDLYLLWQRNAGKYFLSG
jgi:hypothetical protein